MRITFLTRNAVLRGCFVAALALAFAAPSFAGGTNNPAVADLNELYDATSGTSLDVNAVRFHAGQSANAYGFGGAINEETGGTYMVGYVYQRDDESGRYVSLAWFAFEPDSVKRSQDGISIRQRSDIALSLFRARALDLPPPKRRHQLTPIVHREARESV